MPNANYKLNTLSRALDILELVESSPEPLSLTEISGVLKEPTPIIYRALWTLESRGYLYRRHKDKRYQHTGRTTGTGAVRRAISILRALADLAPHGGSSAEIGKILGLSEEVVDELLRPMIDEKIIEPAQTADRWCVSYSLLEIVRPLINNDNLIPTVRPLMESLHAKTGETVSLFHRTGDRQVIVAVVPSTHPVRYALDIGTSYPLHLGAAGKAELAVMPEDELCKILDKDELTSLTQHAPDIKALEAELKKVRKQGYALSFGERVEGASAVATAIRDVTGRVRGVIGIMMPAFRITRRSLASMGELLVSEVGAFYIPPANDGNPKNVAM